MSFIGKGNSSFGETIGEATHNLREALELYFEDEPARLVLAYYCSKK